MVIGRVSSPNLPSEAIHKIVEMFMLRKKKYLRSPENSIAALVCKHWAKVCLRPDEDRVDRLYGRAHVMALRSLVCAPGSYLKHSIVNLDTLAYYLGSKDGPWLHLVPETRSLLTNYTKNDWVSIDGPLCNGLTTMRSIHAYLPRSMPPAFSHGIQKLYLQDIQFSPFQDLQRLLGELSCLEYFQGLGLSWSPAPNTPALYRARSRRRAPETKSMVVLLNTCTYNLEAVTICAALHGRLYVGIRAICESLVQRDAECTVRAAWKVISNGSCSDEAGVLPVGRILCAFAVLSNMTNQER